MFPPPLIVGPPSAQPQVGRRKFVPYDGVIVMLFLCSDVKRAFELLLEPPTQHAKRRPVVFQARIGHQLVKYRHGVLHLFIR